MATEPEKISAIFAALMKNPYSPSFPPYKGADLVVQSSEGISFATRALYLRAVSSVFDDILSLPAQDNHETKEGLPLLKIEEKGDLFTIFLLFVHRDGVVHGCNPPPPTPLVHPPPPLQTLRQVRHPSPRQIHLERIPPSSHRPPRQEPTHLRLAVASIHGLEEVCKTALRTCGEYGRSEAGLAIGKVDLSGNKIAPTSHFRTGCIGDIPLELLSRMPMKDIAKFSSLQARVLAVPEYTWSMAGDDFKL